MKKLLVSLIIYYTTVAFAFADGYNDHRGRNVDSLERVVAKWDAITIENASEEELMDLSVNWRALAQGYKQTNGVKSRYYAEKALELGLRKDWKTTIWDGAKCIGEEYWAKEKYDSASMYFAIAMDAAERMEVVPDGQEVRGLTYSQSDKDDLLSSLYGALGNLYSLQDSISVALSYYEKALGIFKEYGWDTSCSVCYYNMAETVLNTGDDKQAADYYKESLSYAKEAGDSLWIATALKGHGNLYLAQGKTGKALRCLEEADKYFSLHEDEELFARMETLDFTSKVLKLQKKNLAWTIAVLALCLILLLALLGVFHKLRTTRKEKEETAEVLNETLEEMKPDHKLDFKLNDREITILQMLAQGMTSPQIADKMCLSSETIKWYRKKLLLKFDASSSAELVKKAIDEGIIQ